MASPHAAGSYGLLFSKNPSFTPNQLETFLYTTCFDMGGGGNDATTGWGRINLGAAMNLANNNAIHINPSAYRWIRGTQVSGGLADLATGNDGYLRGHGNMVIQPGAPIVLEVDMPSTSSTASVLKVNFEAHNSQSMMIALQLRRWSDNALVTIDTRAYGVVDGAVQINVASPQQYVRAGDNMIQARAVVSLGPTGGQPQMDSFFDVFNVDINP